LFVRVDELDPLVVLGAFYGWRAGRGPLHDHGYVVFAESDLRLTGGTLIRSPEHFTFGWPPEVRDAHYDLEGHTASGTVAFARAVPLTHRLQRVPRLDVLLAQHALSLRPDAPATFVTCVQGRLVKLAKNEVAVMASLREAAAAKGLLAP